MIYLIFYVPLSTLYCEIYIWNLTKNETLQTIDWVLKKKQILKTWINFKLQQYFCKIFVFLEMYD